MTHNLEQRAALAYHAGVRAATFAHSAFLRRKDPQAEAVWSHAARIRAHISARLQLRAEGSLLAELGVQA